MARSSASRSTGRSAKAGAKAADLELSKLVVEVDTYMAALAGAAA